MCRHDETRSTRARSGALPGGTHAGGPALSCRVRAGWLVLGCLAWLAPVGSSAAQQPPVAAAAPHAAAPPEAETLEEVDVVGVQPGPGLWKIRHGDHVLWILGTLDHLPRRMTWRSKAVQAALARSEVLVPAAPSFSARIGPVMMLRLYAQWHGMQRDPNHSRLVDWLPPALYARFEVLKSRYDPHDRRIEELRPPFAALRLYRRTLEAAGLTRGNTIERSVLALAAQYHVPVQRAALRVADPLGTLKQVRALSPADEVGCLAATIDRLESDLPLMQQRARAWAVGDIGQLRRLAYPNQTQACLSTLSAAPDVKALVAAASQGWMQAAHAALEAHRMSFAMRPIYDLLAADGPLARFRAEGFEVEAPR